MPIVRKILMILSIVIYLLAANACSLIKEQRFQLNQATIQNATNGMLYDVKVLHQPTSAVGSTQSLLPNRAFTVGFNHREMMADYSVITWSDNMGNSYRQQIELPKNIDRDTQPKNLTYTIFDDNTVTIMLNPSE